MVSSRPTRLSGRGIFANWTHMADWVWKGKDGRGRYEPAPGAPALLPTVIDHFVIPAKKAAATPKKKAAAPRKVPAREVA